eukprot:13037813-Ditylum_brightwellii.AAC.1
MTGSIPHGWDEDQRLIVLKDRAIRYLQQEANNADPDQTQQQAQQQHQSNQNAINRNQGGIQQPQPPSTYSPRQHQ